MSQEEEKKDGEFEFVEIDKVMESPEGIKKNQKSRKRTLQNYTSFNEEEPSVVESSECPSITEHPGPFDI